MPSFQLAPRSCPVCGSGDESRLFAEPRFDAEQLNGFAFASRKVPEYMRHRLVECPVCDLVYATPLPDRESLARAYREAEFDSADEARYAARTYARALPKLIRSLPDRVGALDVGTGDGAFLEHLLIHGFTEVAGVEPSAAPIASARDDVRPLIRQDIFRPEDFAPERLALLTCFQTIEHVDDPLAFARGAFALLKPGGALSLVCHNRRGLLNRALGMKSPIMDIEHMQLFSPPSARALLERAGFADVSIRPIMNIYPLSYWLRLAPLPGFLKRSALGFCRRSGVGRLPVPMAVGNLAVIGFKR